jgi:hypothetical protein
MMYGEHVVHPFPHHHTISANGNAAGDVVINGATMLEGVLATLSALLFASQSRSQAPKGPDAMSRFPIVSRMETFAHHVSLWLGLVLLVGGVAGCSSITAAEDIMGATVPRGESTPTLDGPTIERFARQYKWQFDTDQAPSAYLDWLAAHLTDRGFAVTKRGGDSLSLVRTAGGDAYRLSIAMSRRSRTHVEAVLRLSAD